MVPGLSANNPNNACVVHGQATHDDSNTALKHQ